MMLCGWGRYPVLECNVQTLRQESDIGQVLERNSSVIARGNGRAYGDASLNPDANFSDERLGQISRVRRQYRHRRLRGWHAAL